MSLADPSKSRDVELSTAYADFSQESGGFLVEKAFDGVIDDADRALIDANGFPFLWEAMARSELRRDCSVLEGDSGL